MNKAIFSACAAAGLVFAQAAIAQQQVPVSFAKGRSATTLVGMLKGDQDRSYLVSARAGQRLVVTLKAIRGSAEMNVYAPGNDTAISLGSANPQRFTTILPTTGRYRVQVYQMRALARRGATASYTLSIAVTGAANPSSSDALVPGTKYNATADLTCTTSIGGKSGRCKAGVIRRVNGDATIEVKTPDGGQRTIYFKGGRPSGSNADTPTRGTKQADLNIVRIGPVEVYEIPDAFVTGD